MQELLIACLTFSFASLYVLFLGTLTDSTRIIQEALVLPIIFILLILYLSIHRSWKRILTGRSKWYVLFLSTIIVQLLVLSTGNINSPFLILIHFFMIVISFICNFVVSLVFLILSLFVILIDIFFIKHTGAIIFLNPTPYILQMTSLVPIIPIAYLISRYYHSKEEFSEVLHNKLLTDEAIMSNLEELVIITDLQLNILSVNDAVERAIQHSHEELLGKPIFSVFLMRDNNNNLVTQNTFFPNGKIISFSKKTLSECTLLGTTLPQKNVTLNIQSINDFQGNISQIIFIINPDNLATTLTTTKGVVLDQARATYEAMFADINNKLKTKNLPEISKQMVMLEKLENDIYQVQILRQSLINQNIARFDSAQLCKQIVQSYIDYASVFNVPVEFNVSGFGLKDIAPLTVKNYPVKPEQLTGPFFTVENDVKNIQIILKKLLEISIFLASSVETPFVSLNIEREGENIILIKIMGNSPVISKNELPDLFLPYYGKLNCETNLYRGSGLEGYILKTLSDQLNLPLEFNYKQDPSSVLTFSIRIKKKYEKASTAQNQ